MNNAKPPISNINQRFDEERLKIGKFSGLKDHRKQLTKKETHPFVGQIYTQFDVNGTSVKTVGTAFLFFPEKRHSRIEHRGIIDDNCRCPSKYSDEQVCIGTCAHMLMHYDIENEVLVPAQDIFVILGKYHGNLND